ncbi:DUF982 domain-containing protein [Bosea sp. Root483D1]|uniref:DUF982 domain-containing protein n=1 Tax=Bosea sp. Root483D1 TaxID=1736544 RepID=UPI0009E80D5B|nr:DUF982 domain-containing protein [Bosea sp. Root483D1]
MPRHWFRRPVCIEASKPEQCLAVTSVEQAAKLLVEWPERSNEWEEAFRACAAAIHGKGTVIEARSASGRQRQRPIV